MALVFSAEHWALVTGVIFRGNMRKENQQLLEEQLQRCCMRQRDDYAE